MIPPFPRKEKYDGAGLDIEKESRLGPLDTVFCNGSSFGQVEDEIAGMLDSLHAWVLPE